MYFFCLNSSYTSATHGNFQELTGKPCEMIEPWSLIHTHSLLQLCKVDNWAGANAVTEWPHCQRQVAFFKFLINVPCQTMFSRTPAGEKLKSERKVKGHQLDFVQKLSKFLVSFAF